MLDSSCQAGRVPALILASGATCSINAEAVPEIKCFRFDLFVPPHCSFLVWGWGWVRGLDDDILTCKAYKSLFLWRKVVRQEEMHKDFFLPLFEIRKSPALNIIGFIIANEPTWLNHRIVATKFSCAWWKWFSSFGCVLSSNYTRGMVRLSFCFFWAWRTFITIIKLSIMGIGICKQEVLTFLVLYACWLLW